MSPRFRFINRRLPRVVKNVGIFHGEFTTVGAYLLLRTDPVIVKFNFFEVAKNVRNTCFVRTIRCGTYP